MKKTLADAPRGTPRRRGGMRTYKPLLDLPHERDEHTSPPGKARRVMRLAAADRATGSVDTDNYTRIAVIYAAAARRRGRRRRNAPGT